MTRKRRAASTSSESISDESERSTDKQTKHPKALDSIKVIDSNPAVSKSPERKKAALDDVPRNQKSLSQGIFGRSLGTYIPPAKLRAMQASITDKSSEEYQKMSWEALKKSINGLINKVNVSNIKNIVPEMFAENLVRGRGLLCRSIMKAQAASLPFTHVYAAVISVVNTKFPQIGELVLHRLISQFRRSYKRNDKPVCISTSKFIAHLVNQRVAHEIISLQILTLLLEKPTDDSVEVAVSFMRECGFFLADASPRANNAVYERFRAILHEGQIDKRTQYMVEVLFQVRRDKYKDNPSVMEDLDLVEEEDQITHYVSLDDKLEILEGLNVFKYDVEYLDNEEKYSEIKKEILGSDSEEGSEAEDEADSDDDVHMPMEQIQEKMKIQDETNTNLINLRRGIYLTIMSSLNYEECAHKLVRMDIPEPLQMELCNMIIECCSQERTYVNFYGLLGERFSKMNQMWASKFAQAFEESFKTIHRYETNKLRNVSKYFAHLLATDAIGWQVFSIVRITEQETTSSSRIFLKILFQELCESLGIQKLNTRLQDPTMAVQVGREEIWVYGGLFPTDNPRNTRFSINYFTSIGLGALTESMREWLKNAPKRLVTKKTESSSSDTDSSDSGSSDSGSSDSDSGSSSDSSSGSDSD